MYRDESETQLENADLLHSFATAFLRNIRCTTVLSTNVQSVRLLKMD